MDFYSTPASYVTPSTVVATLTNDQYTFTTLASNTTNKTNGYMVSKNVIYAIFVMNGILSLVGLLGNIFVCVIIIRGRKMYTIANLFLMNLAIADICVLIISYPLWVIQTLSGSWPFGAALCKILLSVSDAFYGVSLGCMTTISIHRYRMILHAMGTQLSFFQAKIIIIFIWFISLSTISVPLYPVIKYFKVSDTCRCGSFWPSQTYERSYQTVLTIVWYILPLLIILSTFLRIRFYLRKQMQYEWLQGSNHNILISNHILGIKKALRMLAPVVIIFAMLMLPWNILRGISLVTPLHTIPYFQVYIFISGTMLITNSVVNPFIYYIMSVEFRIEFKKQLWLMKNICGLKSSSEEYAVAEDKHGRRFVRRLDSLATSEYQNGSMKARSSYRPSRQFSNGNSIPDYDSIFEEQKQQDNIGASGYQLCRIMEENGNLENSSAHKGTKLDLNDNTLSENTRTELLKSIDVGDLIVDHANLELVKETIL